MSEPKKDGPESKNRNYLRQVLVVRRDLSMPTGKAMAMAAHASMSFLLKRMKQEVLTAQQDDYEYDVLYLTPDQRRWLTELDPGLEGIGQVSMAKIVLEVNGEASLMAVEHDAKAAGLECHRVVDSGFSHNKPGTLVCIAIGPDWPEKLDPVTGGLKVYR